MWIDTYMDMDMARVRGACMARGVLSQRESVLRHVDDGAGRPVKRNERDGPCERWRAPALASASGRLGSCPRLLSVAAHVEKGVALEVVGPARGWGPPEAGS